MEALLVAARLEAIAARLEAIATRLEAMASRLEAIAVLVGWRPLLLGWRPLLLGWRQCFNFFVFLYTFPDASLTPRSDLGPRKGKSGRRAALALGEQKK